VVYAKPPCGGPEEVLKYLARYTHRVAISSSRLLSLDHGRVTFRWRDSKSGNQMKSMTLDAVEFIRRFLLHILPLGFVNIRHFGFLANRNRAAALALCRDLLKPSADRSVSILPPRATFCRRAPLPILSRWRASNCAMALTRPDIGLSARSLASRSGGFFVNQLAG
jgi:hypothetical protein